jgi:hypothetical protein
MAVEVFGRDATIGDDDAGFRGSGGGALSGSELSHLRHKVNRGSCAKTVQNAYIGTIALP